jgi:protein-ribulosamine 3-kinase
MLYRAYNDMLYLCEKYGPLDSLEKYDPEVDISVTGAHIPFVISQLE